MKVKVASIGGVAPPSSLPSTSALLGGRRWRRRPPTSASRDPAFVEVDRSSSLPLGASSARAAPHGPCRTPSRGLSGEGVSRPCASPIRRAAAPPARGRRPPQLRPPCFRLAPPPPLEPPIHRHRPPTAWDTGAAPRPFIGGSDHKPTGGGAALTAGGAAPLQADFGSLLASSSTLSSSMPRSHGRGFCHSWHRRG